MNAHVCKLFFSSLERKARSGIVFEEVNEETVKFRNFLGIEKELTSPYIPEFLETIDNLSVYYLYYAKLRGNAKFPHKGYKIGVIRRHPDKASRFAELKASFGAIESLSVFFGDKRSVLNAENTIHKSLQRLKLGKKGNPGWNEIYKADISTTEEFQAATGRITKMRKEWGRFYPLEVAEIVTEYAVNRRLVPHTR